MQVRALAAILVVPVLVTVLSGCGDDGGRTEAASPTATPTPEPVVYTADQLQAALPTTAELQAEFENVSSCPEDEGCGTETISVGGTDAGGDATWGIGASVWLALTPTADDAAAADVLASRRSADDQLSGDFAVPASERDDDPEHYAPGKTGTGTNEDFTQDGWTGYRGSATYHLTDPDGEQTDEPVSESWVRLTRGNAVLEIQVGEPGEDTGATDAELEARLKTLLDALAA